MKVLSLISSILPYDTAYAHCDIPCGIYEPTPLQIAAHTVLRMSQLLGEHTQMHDVARVIRVKEDHGSTVEKELMTLKNDYFKPEHYEANPQLEKLLQEAVGLSAKTRQKVDVDLAKELVEKCLVISEIFYKTKGFEPIRISSGFPTEGELVSHK